MRSASLAFETAQMTAVASAPAPTSSADSLSAAPRLMSAIATIAPAAANAWTIPRPIPRAPPVTITALPSNSPTAVDDNPQDIRLSRSVRPRQPADTQSFVVALRRNVVAFRRDADPDRAAKPRRRHGDRPHRVLAEGPRRSRGAGRADRRDRDRQGHHRDGGAGLGGDRGDPAAGGQRGARWDPHR